MNSRNVLFPVGFRFQPTDEELVKYFLVRKINGCAMNQDGKIKDIDIYNHEPIELYDPNFDYGDGKMYFFTPLHMIRSNGQKAKRNTKHGFWRATQKCNNILDMSGNTIGIKMPLAYYSKAQNSIPRKTSWLMSEYRLPKEYISSPQWHDPSIVERIVLCVIYNNERSKKINISSNHGGHEDKLSEVAESNIVLPSIPISSPIPYSNLNLNNPIPYSYLNPNNPIPYSHSNLNNFTCNDYGSHENKMIEVTNLDIALPSIRTSSPIPYFCSDLSNNLISSSFDHILDYDHTFDDSLLNPIFIPSPITISNPSLNSYHMSTSDLLPNPKRRCINMNHLSPFNF